jgi:Flp pilus assembly protein TadG
MKKKLLEKALIRNWRAFTKNTSGTILILTALILPLLVGIAGLAIQVGVGYSTRRTLQTIADTIAIGGATEIANGGINLLQRAQADAIANNFTPGGSNTLTVNNPPLSGAYTNNASAVEVILTQKVSLAFTNLFLASPVTISARAIATSQAAPPCILALDPSLGSSFKVAGNSTVSALNCTIGVNSTSPTALDLSGSGLIIVNADRVLVTGNYVTSGSSQINTTNGIQTGAPPTADPYATVQIPSYSGCNANNFAPTKSQTISPGVYCGGISIGSQTALTLNPGIYILDGGQLSLKGQASITGTGVTLILTSSSQTNYPTISLTDSANIILTAPSQGPTAGIAIYQDRNAPSSGVNTIGSISSITGALYFPRQILQYRGNSALTACTQLIARQILFTGASTAGVKCPKNIIPRKITLVE